MRSNDSKDFEPFLAEAMPIVESVEFDAAPWLGPSPRLEDVADMRPYVGHASGCGYGARVTR